MAESITEGTLKQWLKKKGDYVTADEEVATIETDKVGPPGALRSFASKATREANACSLFPQIDVAVNAPFAGTITELLAAEDDTVTVGGDLFVLEKGSAPEGGLSSPQACSQACWIARRELTAGHRIVQEAQRHRRRRRRRQRRSPRRRRLRSRPHRGRRHRRRLPSLLLPNPPHQRRSPRRRRPQCTPVAGPTGPRPGCAGSCIQEELELRRTGS